MSSDRRAEVIAHQMIRYTYIPIYIDRHAYSMTDCHIAPVVGRTRTTGTCLVRLYNNCLSPKALARKNSRPSADVVDALMLFVSWRLDLTKYKTHLDRLC